VESLKLAHFHLKQSNSILWELKCFKIDGWVGRCMSEWTSERRRASRYDVQWNLYFNEHQNNKLFAWHISFCAQQLTIYFSMAQQPIVDLVIFFIEASLSHSRHTTLNRTPLDEWSAWCTDLYLTTNNTHKRQTSMSPVGFEPTIPVSKRLQIWILDRQLYMLISKCSISTNTS
jgi:hypothetical protein